MAKPPSGTHLQFEVQKRKERDWLFKAGATDSGSKRCLRQSEKKKKNKNKKKKKQNKSGASFVSDDKGVFVPVTPEKTAHNATHKDKREAG